MKTLTLIAVVSLLPWNAGAEPSDTESGVATAIDSVLRKASQDDSGYAIIVEIDGKVVLSKGYGYADRGRKIPFKPTTVAQIGSLSKQFAATAILQLEEDGTVDLEKPIRSYIPELTTSAGDMTIKQLLTHSSGLVEYCGDDFERVSRDRFVRNCLSSPLRFEPGTGTAYSNVGYSAIAAIVEYSTSRSFEDYLLESVLRPNGLASTDHLFSGDPDHEFARGYLEGRDVGNIAERIRTLGDDWWNLKGNGGMQASTLDMYAWYKVLNGDGTLADSIRSELTVPHSPWVDGVAEGYGWYFRSDDSGRARQMSHSGSDGVFFSYYWHRLDKHAFMYFVGNSGEEPTKNTLRRILGLLTSYLQESG